MIGARRIKELRDNLGLRLAAAADGVGDAVGQPIRRRGDHRRDRIPAERYARVVADDGRAVAAQFIDKPLRVVYQTAGL